MQPQGQHCTATRSCSDAYLRRPQTMRRKDKHEHSSRLSMQFDCNLRIELSLEIGILDMQVFRLFMASIILRAPRRKFRNYSSAVHARIFGHCMLLDGRQSRPSRNTGEYEECSRLPGVSAPSVVFRSYRSRSFYRNLELTYWRLAQGQSQAFNEMLSSHSTCPDRRNLAAVQRIIPNVDSQGRSIYL